MPAPSAARDAYLGSDWHRALEEHLAARNRIRPDDDDAHDALDDDLAEVSVPYRGGAPALQDLIGGRFDYLCPTDLTALAQIESGTIKGIAVLGANRSPNLPGLASAREQGLADFDVGIWFALVVPKAVPAPIVRKLHDATVAAMELPIVQTRHRAASAGRTSSAAK